MGFAEVMKLVNSLDYEVVVFDTAPTGHTLRFLSFPNVLQKALTKLSEMSGRFGPLMSQVVSLCLALSCSMSPSLSLSIPLYHVLTLGLARYISPLCLPLPFSPW